MTNEELYYLPASELLKHIQAEKERLIKEKIIKKSKGLAPITDEEIPYGLPIEWEWVRLGDIVDFIDYRGKTPKKTDSGIRLITAKNIKFGFISYTPEEFIGEEDYDTWSVRGIPKKGDVIFTTEAPMGNVAIVDTNEKFVLAQRAICFPQNKFIINKFLMYCIMSKGIQKQLVERATGTTVLGIKASELKQILLPLPPLYIQDQIVQKLEQLSKTKDSLLSHAESQFNYTKKMREALLQEAIRGELVSQNENDEPASVLLEKIKAEKERLIKEKVIKKQKELPPITDEEKPYELPAGWEWVRLGEIGDWGAGATPLRSRSDYYTNGTVPWLKTGELNDGYITKCEEYITELALKETSVRVNKPGDVLIAMYGATIGKLGILEIEATTNQACCACSVFNGINNKFLFYFLRSMRENFKEMSEGGAQPNISKDKISKTVFPLPPLAEQKRIVAKLDELMANCDQLESKAEKMKNYTSKLFEASLKEAFMPE